MPARVAPRTPPRTRGTGTTPTDRIKAQALALGFDAVGIAGIEPLEAQAHFAAWIDAGRHGTMGWLAKPRSRERRADPARILPGIASVVCVALCHEPARDPTRDRRLGRIARYAVGEDYHRIMHDQLGALQDFIEHGLQIFLCLLGCKFGLLPKNLVVRHTMLDRFFLCLKKH